MRGQHPWLVWSHSQINITSFYACQSGPCDVCVCLSVNWGSMFCRCPHYHSNCVCQACPTDARPFAHSTLLCHWVTFMTLLCCWSHSSTYLYCFNYNHKFLADIIHWFFRNTFLIVERWQQVWFVMYHPEQHRPDKWCKIAHGRHWHAPRNGAWFCEQTSPYRNHPLQAHVHVLQDQFQLGRNWYTKDCPWHSARCPWHSACFCNSWCDDCFELCWETVCVWRRGWSSVFIVTWT